MTERAELYPGFETQLIQAGEVNIHVRVGGAGPAVLCLHGYPQTHACWHRLAGELAASHTVVLMDLRGYGESDAPVGGEGHETYSKRAMARDAVAVMRALGHAKFSVMGHDRGARVAYRLAIDTPEVVDRLVILDILPTLAQWERFNAVGAIKSYHWPFLAQPYPLPEKLIGADPVYYLEHTLASWTKDRSLACFDDDALTHYRAMMEEPARIHAMCEDYRAGATYDWEADLETRDRGKKIAAPTLVLWSSDYLNAGKKLTDPIGVWTEWASDVRGAEIDCGHFLAEENPGATLREVLPFLETGDCVG